jgi:hypothetical protein
MHYQRIALILIVLLAIAMNAATNIVPVLHPPQCQTKTLYLDDVILLWWCQKVLGGGANSPPMQPSLRRQIAVRHGVTLSGHSTISLPHPVLRPYKQRIHIMNEVIVLL